MPGFASSSPTADPHPRGLPCAGGSVRAPATWICHGLVQAGKSPKFIPSLFFSSSAARQRGCSTQMGGGCPAGTPSAGEPRGSTVGPSPCYSTETRSWREQKGNWCKETHFLAPAPSPLSCNRTRTAAAQPGSERWWGLRWSSPRGKREQSRGSRRGRAGKRGDTEVPFIPQVAGAAARVPRGTGWPYPPALRAAPPAIMNYLSARTK